MARPKSFDPTAVLDRAMDLFWAHGYEATSIDDLARHTGVTRPALYRQWGSKHQLYQAALYRYRATSGKHFVEALEARPTNAVSIIRDRLVEIVCEAIESPDQRGCFLVNAICERSSLDSATETQATDALATLETRITSALETAAQRGALDHPDPASLARFFVVVIMGLRVVGKARPTEDALRGVVTEAMRAASIG